ncbi:cellulase family glycosylhydrolase [Candidatus Bathyarchaeota archaeon]|nr:cellulase family glycosylhydrolase [Candidatus Bathyarchaeota archaeon]
MVLNMVHRSLQGFNGKSIGILSLALVACGVFIPISEYWGVRTPAPVLEWNGQPFRPIGVNYYPRDHPWTGTWTDYNATELRQDLDRIVALGGNCIRTFIQWELIEPQEGVYNVTIVNRVMDFFDACSDKNIAIMFSFFDFGPPDWSGYTSEEQDQMYVDPSLITRQVAQLEYLIPLLNESSAAFLWDLRNEPRSKTVSREQFSAWVANLTATIKNLGDTHYVAVGGGWDNFEDPSIYADLDVDLVCMHFYGARDKPNWKRRFQSYIEEFSATGKPVILQEFGWPTWEGIGITEEMQACYYKAIFDECDRSGVAGIMPWCLWDFTVDLDWRNEGDHSEEHFGLLRVDGTWKPSGQAFRDYATGNHRRTWNINMGGRF